MNGAMPSAAPRPCANPACSKLVGKGYCDACAVRVQAVEPARPSAHARGYDSKWTAFRAAFLVRHPLCARCPVPTPATVVDHVVPHKGDRKLFWKKGNHQALCKSCHDRKTATEDGGFGRVTTRNQAAVGGGIESLGRGPKRPEPSLSRHTGSKGGFQ